MEEIECNLSLVPFFECDEDFNNFIVHFSEKIVEKNRTIKEKMVEKNRRYCYIWYFNV